MMFVVVFDNVAAHHRGANSIRCAIRLSCQRSPKIDENPFFKEEKGVEKQIGSQILAGCWCFPGSVHQRDRKRRGERAYEWGAREIDTRV